MNPVLLLDEVDKVGSDWRGDPSSALLEVLDPAQNHTFRDHYLEVDLDLSDVLFIATANVLETIPGPLLDRLELVRLDGYTEDEKVAIARDHLLARQLERNGLSPARSSVTDDAVCARSSPTTPGRPACGASSASSASCCARRPRDRRRATRTRRSPIDVDDVADSSGRPRFHAEARRAHRGARRGHRPGRHRRRRRRAVRRGHGHGRRAGGADHHRPARRRHEGVGPDRAVVRAVARRGASACGRRRSTSAGSTCTCPPARCPRTGRRPASP